MISVYKVVVVDDEPTVIHGLCKQIDWESLNMELAGTATNGEDALFIMSQQHIDLLITDIRMPEMDGLTLLKKARLIHPGIRCIIVSAYDEFEYVKQALKLGAENYLLKPINNQELDDTLHKTLKNLEQESTTESMMSSDMLAFRNNILDRWLNGTIQDFELYERAELLNINLSAPQHLVCVIDIVHPSDMDQKFKYATKLLNITRTVLTPLYKGEYFLDGSFRVILLLHGHSMHSVQNDLAAYLKKLCKQTDTADIKFFCSLGPVVDNYSKVNLSYTTAVFYLNYRLLQPDTTAVCCECFPDVLQDVSGRKHTLLLEFIRALKEENGRQAILCAQKYIKQFTVHSLSELQTAMTPLILSLIRTVFEAGRTSDVLPGFLLSQISKFAGLNSSKDLEDWMLQTIHDALQVISERKGTFHLLIRLTLDQINQKYNENISLKTLAANFNVTPAYLGQLFKAETGELFNDYLMQVRMQAARNLLLNTNMKIGDIISRIGITNQSYFNRVFKKTYGVSPTEFRRNRQ